MALLSVSGVSRSFGQNLLFENVGFTVSEKDKIGFVGANGVGKTTLFKILSGIDTPDSGVVSVNCKIGYMEQYALASSETTLFDEVSKEFARLQETEIELADIADAIDMKKGDIDTLIRRQHRLREQYEESGGLTYKSRTRSTLLGLGFSEDELILPVSALSGGEKTRASLAKLLLGNANLLLLDEPTNHLDMEAIAWLEDYLPSYNGAFVVISHDRYFLDKVTSKTFELESAHLTVYSGGYSQYLAQKQENLAVAKRHYDNQMREIHRIEGIIKQQRQWNRERNIKTAESKQKMIDRQLQNIEKPVEVNNDIHMSFSPKKESGNDVLRITDAQVSFDGVKLFENACIDIKKGDTAFILGGNGTGKTTLLNVISGRIEPDFGEVHFGTGVLWKYYEQTSSDLNGDNTVLEEIRNEYPLLTETEIRNSLAMFLFLGDDVFKSVATLSGGERARVALLKVMLAMPNLLLLDEPTNHLDIESREALEKALLDYKGTALIVSHDRYFINKLATKIYKIGPDGTVGYDGNYDYYLQKSVPDEVIKQVKVKSSYKEEKERQSQKRQLEGKIKRLEQDIETLEEQIVSLENELINAGADYKKAMELSNEIDNSKSVLSEYYEQWNSLSDELASVL